MASIAGTRQERRRRYLDLAAEAETFSAKLSDPTAKAHWIDMAVSWMMMASEISSEDGESRNRLCSGVPYWKAMP